MERVLTIDTWGFKDTLDSWQIAEKIIACGFDTTSSNTGIHNGATSWTTDTVASLPSSHSGAGGWSCIYSAVRSNSLQTAEDFLGLPGPGWHCTSYHYQDEQLTYINHFLHADNVKNLPRCDYKEFLESAKLILGESIERKKGYLFTIQSPGADHHAR